jgi:hypothetical protein
MDRWITTVDITWNESWMGTEQVRYYLIDAGTLTVVTPWRPSVIFDGRVAQTTLTWMKIE